MDRSANMRAIRSKNTGPELAVRSLAHRLGYRFRLHRKNLPGTPDLVFVSRRKVIFVHGCFWHGHDCKRARIPTANREFWVEKIAKNQGRDEASLTALASAGWKALVLWQCELKDADGIEARMRQFLG